MRMFSRWPSKCLQAVRRALLCVTAPLHVQDCRGIVRGDQLAGKRRQRLEIGRRDVGVRRAADLLLRPLRGSAVYRQGEYNLQKEGVTKLHKEAANIFEPKGFKIMKLHDLQSKPLKSGGESTSFFLFMTKEGTETAIAQTHFVMTPDKKDGIYVVHTYDLADVEKAKTLAKELADFKLLEK